VSIHRSEHRITRSRHPGSPLIAQARSALDRGTPVRIETRDPNTDRTAGAMLSGEIAKRYGHTGLRTTPSR